MDHQGYTFFIGDIALDEYYSTEYFPKIRDKVIVHTLPSQMGGMIANAASVYASYQQPAKFLTGLNNGFISQKLCESLRESGIDITYMVWDDSLPDAKTIIILAEDEHTIFIPTMGIQRLEISPETLKAICNAEYIYSNFCELKPLTSGDLDAAGILSRARSHGAKIWCDLDVGDLHPQEEHLFNYVDTLFVNEIGFKNLSGTKSEEETKQFLFQKGIEMIVVTYADKGCRIFTEQNEFTVKGINVPVTDVTGAGDTFCSSFLYAYKLTKNIQLSAEFANYAAARAVTIMGGRAGACGTETVLQFIKEHGEDTERFNFF
ncbi:carbohydrate kinase family protein [Bacillus sp. B-jedd]|uniref:carbohydrate kinase family protein n=1 Tax=Bacillus sp. B-jedd TaxID=1476857 RepID=UPI0005155D2D|nr:carbohydrate kinase family protein [Bacillus sp. B-jedd]CEG26375.1 ribokinase [Bacillus sp. B-jedd]